MVYQYNLLTLPEKKETKNMNGKTRTLPKIHKLTKFMVVTIVFWGQTSKFHTPLTYVQSVIKALPCGQ